jgi:acetyl esterase/lipase
LHAPEIERGNELGDEMPSRFSRIVLAALVISTIPAGGVLSATSPGEVKHYATEAFAELPAIDRPKLSPGGKAIAAKIAIKGKQYFAIMPVGGGAPRLVELGDTDLNWWRWVNDDWLVVGVGELQAVEGDKWYVSRAISIRADAGKMNALAGHEAGQNADDVIWVARDGSPRILMALQTSIYRNEPGFWPHVEEVDVSTGRRKIVQPGQDGVWNWYADGGGAIRMGIGMTDDGRARRVLYRAGARGSFRIIDRARTHKEPLIVPTVFLKDAGKALIIADDDGGYSSLYELDLGTLERGKQLFSTPGFDITGLVSDDSGFSYAGIETLRDKAETVWIDPAMAAMQKTISARIKGGEPRIVSLNRDHSKAIVQVGVANAPGAYFLYDAASDAMDMIGVNNATMQMARLHPVRTIRYKARDGLEIPAVLTLPKGQDKNLPLIVMPHGGPFARDDEEWDWWAQFLADRGYAVVQPNYRGSSGYGTPFTQKGEGQWGLAMQDDLNDAVTALAQQGIADPKRVCMVGASYGGYAAMRAAQRDGKLYRCAVSYAGVSDLNRWTREDAGALGSGARKDWLKMQAPDLKSVSPINYPEQVSIPLLLMHGKKDQTVAVAHSRTMAARLKAAGKDVTYIEQPEGDHHFSRSEDRLEFLKALEAFLAKHNPA